MSVYVRHECATCGRLARNVRLGEWKHVEDEAGWLNGTTHRIEKIVVKKR